jgi:hypothetical protein
MQESQEIFVATMTAKPMATIENQSAKKNHGARFEEPISAAGFAAMGHLICHRKRITVRVHGNEVRLTRCAGLCFHGSLSQVIQPHSRGRRVCAQRTLKSSGGSGTGLLPCKG